MRDPVTNSFTPETNDAATPVAISTIPPVPADKQALDKLVEDLYARLKPLAARVRWRGANPSLNPTALVNEAYLRLSNAKGFGAKTHNEVIGIFVHVMRQILVEGARRQNTLKRGAGGIVPLVLGDLNGSEPSSLPLISPENLLALHAALEELRRIDPLQADIMDRRFYLGLTAQETADVLLLTKSKLEREERKAKRFLQDKLQS